MFTHLHCHSHYSLLDGLSKIDPLVERAKELGMTSLALTDHGSLYGTIEFYNKCKELDIKPIIGMEGYIAPRSMHDKEGKSDADYFHITLIAKDSVGYKNLMELCSLGFTEGFYYKPRIDTTVLKKYSAGLLALSGCQRGQVARGVMQSEGQGKAALELNIDIFGKDNFFIEVQRNALEKEDIRKEAELNNRLIKLAREYNIPIVATGDCHYIDPDDGEAQDILVCIGTGRKVTDENRLNMRSHELSVKSEEKMRELFADLPEAIDNTQLVVEKCDLEIPVNQRYFPTVPLPDGETNESYLTKVVHEKSFGLYAKDGAIPPAIQERIDYELDIICSKGFASYFLMVADIVEGAHSIGAITNTRGSAAGSIVGKILGITNADPLYYELPFERFLTKHRPTPPDIDLDIADNRRDEAIEWITARYGKEKVAQIITFGTMKARAAVRDVGRALGVAYGKCDRIAKMIPIGKQGFDMTIDSAMEMNPELKDVFQRDPETNKIITIAKKIEGCARHASIHAAGIVITPTALLDYMPVQKEPDGDRLITQYDMYALDTNANGKAIGAIKMDLLGIRNLSILETAVNMVKERHKVDIDIYNLPHPDKKTFEVLSAGHTFAVFQLGSSGMTRYLKELKPSNIFDLSAMIALYRPGPLQFIPEYIARKHNPSLIKYLDPELERILKRTYGVLVYQDDLLVIAHDLAGYTWEEVDKFRKAVGKKDPEVMAKQKEKFVEGCVNTSGWTSQKANEIWSWIEPFAAYGFNKSHSASYAVVSYQTAYMKANYTVEFMASVMTAESGDEDKIYAAVEECNSLGIQVLPPDVNESLGDFTVVDEKTIRFGLSAIKNLGSDVITKIIEVRQTTGKGFDSLQDFLNRGTAKNFNKRSWEALVKGGALDRFGERGQLLANTEFILEFLRDKVKSENSGQNSLFGNSAFSDIKLQPAAPASKEDMLGWEKEHLGMYVSAHPLDNYKQVLKSFNRVKQLNESKDDQQVTLGGIISKMKRTMTKKNEPMAFFTLEDGTGSVEVLVFPKVFPPVAHMIQADAIVQIKGKLSNRDGEIKIIADTMDNMPSDDLYLMALGEMEKKKEIVIHLANGTSKESLEKMKTILESFPGSAPVFVSIQKGTESQKVKTASSVRISNELVAQLRRIPDVVTVAET